VIVGRHLGRRGVRKGHRRAATFGGISNKETVAGMPDENLISTSCFERQNLSMRMHMRRLTRLSRRFAPFRALPLCANPHASAHDAVCVWLVSQSKK